MAEPFTGCPDADVLADLALGELTGRDRAAALHHVAECARCRDELDALVDTTDRVLLAAPLAEPPAGFEAAVLHRVRHDRRRTRRTMPIIAAAAAVVLVVVGVAAVLLTGHSTGSLDEARMVTPTGRDVGAVWRYDDTPGWVFLAVPGWEAWEDQAEPHTYLLQATLATGKTVDLGTVRFDDGDGDWGTTVSIDPSDIRRVAIVDEDGRTWCEGTFT